MSSVPSVSFVERDVPFSAVDQHVVETAPHYPSQPPRSRAVNWRLLLATVIAVLVAAPAVMVWHTRQIKHVAEAFLGRADRLEAEQKWESAADYLHRYLRIYPQDARIWVRLAHTYDKSVRGGRRRSRAIDLYYRAAGVAPNDLALRERLCRLLLEEKRFLEAQQQAEALSKIQPESRPGRVVRALAMYGLATSGGVVTLDDAIAEMRKVLEVHPGEIELALVFANVCREPSRLRSEDAGAALADLTMQRLVEALPDSAEAHLARYRYRRLHGLPGAEADLTQALALGPSDPEVLLTAGDHELRLGNAEAAKSYFHQAQSIVPQHPLVQLKLGEACAHRGETEQAIAAWRKGLVFEPGNILLNLRLAEVYVDGGRLEEAQAALDSLEAALAAGDRNQVRLAATPERLAAQVARARWHHARREPMQASAVLRRVLPAAAEANAPDTPPSRSAYYQALILLARIHFELAEWDAAALTYERALERWPSLPQLRVAAASAWAAGGRWDMAVRQSRRALEFDKHLEEAWLLLVDSEWALEIRRAEAARNWNSLLQTVERGVQAVPDSWRLRLFQGRILLKHPEESRRQAGVELLQRLESDHAEAPEVWRALASAYHQATLPADAERALARYTALTGDNAAAALIRAEMLVRRREVDQARTVLRTALQKHPGEHGTALVTALLRLSQLATSHAERRRQLEDLQRLVPTRTDVLRELVELAVRSGEFELAQRRENQLKALEGDQGCQWRLCRALRLLAESRRPTDPRLLEADQLRNQIEQRRQQWADLAWLTALIRERQQIWGEAIDAYIRALEHGIEPDKVAEPLVRLLVHTERLDEADQFLRRFEAEGPLTTALNALAVEVADRRGRPDQSLVYAQRIIERLPNDPLARLQLGQALLALGRRQEAETAFREAVRLGPGEARTWLGLFLYFVAIGDRDEARRTLGQMAEAVDLPADERDFLLAQGYGVVGDDAKTEELLRGLIGSSPENNKARRMLAAVLAARNDEEAFREAQEMLGRQTGSEGSDPTDHRTRAALLLGRGRPQDLEQARAIMTALVDGAEAASSQDRALLADVCERQGDFAAARQQLAAACAEDDAPVGVVIRYAEFLMRRREFDMAEAVLSAAAKRHPTNADLTFTLANVRLQQHRLADAAALYERTTQINPRHLAAWNNLAYSLMEQPGQAERALQAIDRGIRLADGEVPTLIDTKASVLLKLGQVSEAVALLEQLVARSEAKDPRFYFHLALAYRQAGASEASRDAIARARQLGLAGVFLTKTEHGELAQLDRWLAE